MSGLWLGDWAKGKQYESGSQSTRCQCLVPGYSLTLNIEIEIRNLKSKLKIKIDNWN